MSVKLTTEEVKIKLQGRGLTMIEDYVNAVTKIKCIDEEGYTVYAYARGTKINPNRFHQGNKDTLKNIEKWLSINNPCYKLIKNQKYVSSHTHLKINCEKCGEIFQINWGDLQFGNGCPYCAGRKISENNCLHASRPDLTKFFEDANVSKIVSPKSHKRVTLICPDCGTKRTMIVSQLSSQGFSCCSCRDGISIPEKFTAGILSQLNLSFIREWSPEWVNKKRYDFYLPKIGMIIETHGEQHYKNKFKGVQTEDQKKNDDYKEFMASKNGIKKYVILDCRNTSLAWMKESFIDGMSAFFDLSNIDWDEAYELSNNRICVEAWNLWNSGMKSTTKISKALNINKCTAREYLLKGSELKKTDYSTELAKATNKKPVYQYSVEGELIKRWESITDAAKEIGTPNSNIGSCLRNKTKTAGGFIWRYENDHI